MQILKFHYDINVSKTKTRAFLLLVPISIFFQDNLNIFSILKFSKLI